MPTITFQFVGASGLASRLIEWKGAGPYSHVDVVTNFFGDLVGARSDRVGGAPSGVQIRTADYAAWDSIARITIEVSKRKLEKFWEFVVRQIGKPYDHMAIFAFIINRNWQEDDSWFCSELVMAACVHAGIFKKHPLALAANKIDPSTAFAVLSTHGTVEIIKKS